MRTSVIVVALLVSAGQASASSCEGPRPWKSPDAVQYSDTDLRLFYDLAIQTRLAYSDGDKAKAKRVAQEYLSAASRFTCDWNYGNAVHDANAVLGLIALQEGHREAAVRYLLAAGLSRGSPQRDSFGPSLLLAKLLAEAGEFDAVATYVRSIRRFWEADDTTTLGFLGFGDRQPMTSWLKKLASRKVPNFGMNALKAP